MYQDNPHIPERDHYTQQPLQGETHYNNQLPLNFCHFLRNMKSLRKAFSNSAQGITNVVSSSPKNRYIRSTHQDEPQIPTEDHHTPRRNCYTNKLLLKFCHNMNIFLKFYKSKRQSCVSFSQEQIYQDYVLGRTAISNQKIILNNNPKKKLIQQQASTKLLSLSLKYDQLSRILHK